MPVTLLQLLAISTGLSLIPIVGVLRARFVVPAVLVVSLVILILHGYAFWDSTVDDAYISFRYSQNFAHGDGLVWNPGERVEGYSNFLWVILLAGTEVVGLGIVEPSRWLGFAATAGTLVAVYLLARELSEDAADAAAVFALSALMLVFAAPVAFWTFAGLETPLFVMLVALCLWLHIREDAGAASLPLSAIVALLAALTRPEGLLLALGILLLKLVRASLQAIPARGVDKATVRQIGLWIAVFAVPYAAFLLFRVSYYGSLLPNTYYQKLDGQTILSWDRYEYGYQYVKQFWEQYGLVLIFPLPLVPLLLRASRPAAIPLVAFGAAWTLYVVYAGADFLQFFRFLAPVLPIAYVLSATALIAIARFAASFLTARNRRISAAHARAFVLLAMLPVSASLMHVPQPLINEARFWEAVADQRYEISEWLRTQDPDVVIAVNAAGQLPYWSEVRSIDTLGLTDEHIARREPYNVEPRTPGHMKGDARYILNRRPDIIIVTAGLFLLPLSKQEWQEQGANLPADQELLAQPDLWELYDPAWVKTSSGRVFNFLLLKGTPRVTAFVSPENRVQY